MSYDPYEPDLGGYGPDEYVGTITDAFFGTDSRVNNGQTTMCFLKFKVENNPEFPELTEQYSCGGDLNLWKTTDGGQTVSRQDGKDKSFNAKSKYMELIQRAVQLGMRPQLDARGGPLKAAAWVGFRLHMGTETRNYGGEIGVKPIKLPLEWLAEPTGKTITDPAHVAAPTVEPAVDAELHTKLVAAAKTHEYLKFVDAALELPGVAGDDSLVAALADESYYTKLRTE
jgi:hypothetical protein